MAREPGCPFCDIVAGEGAARVVARGRGVTAFFPDEPATLGHTLVVPNDHIVTVWELDQGKARNLASEVLRVSNAVRDALSPEGLNIIQSNGPVATQTVAHLHVHVLPRWQDDAVDDFWPVSPEVEVEALDGARSAIAASVEASASPGYDVTDDHDREDRRKHLDLVSAVIARLAGSSAAAKGWSVTLSGAAFGVALARESWPLIAIGVVVLISFGLLDARYLEAERRAIAVYSGIAEANSVAPFSMAGLATSSTKHRWWWPARFRSWSIAYFYAPLALAGAGLLVFAAFNFGDPESPGRHHPDRNRHKHHAPHVHKPQAPPVSPSSSVSPSRVPTATSSDGSK